MFRLDEEKPRFRSKSMHQIRKEDYGKEVREELMEKKELSCYEKINEKLLGIDEVKRCYKKIKIPPFYVLLILITTLGLIIIRIFNKNISLSFSTVYPLFMTFKAIQYYDKEDSESKKEVVHWLKYWVFYSALLNIETLFSFILKEFYTFCKIILILNCFPIKSGLLDYIYSLIFSFFSKYEEFIVRLGWSVKMKIINEEDGEYPNFGAAINRNINEGVATIRLIKKII